MHGQTRTPHIAMALLALALVALALPTAASASRVEQAPVRTQHPGHCPEGYVWTDAYLYKLNPDGSITVQIGGCLIVGNSNLAPDLPISDGTGGAELPPGVCYNDAVGTYYCPFDISWLPPEFFEDEDDPNGLNVAARIVVEDEPVVQINPDLIGCPEGWVPVTPPVNPQLGRCQPGTIVPASGPDTGVVQIDPNLLGCPEGWVPATPPLNPALGCLPNTEASAETGVDSGDSDDSAVSLAVLDTANLDGDDEREERDERDDQE